MPGPRRALSTSQNPAAAVSAPRWTAAGARFAGSKWMSTCIPATPSPSSRVIGTPTRVPGGAVRNPAQSSCGAAIAGDAARRAATMRTGTRGRRIGESPPANRRRAKNRMGGSITHLEPQVTTGRAYLTGPFGAHNIRPLPGISGSGRENGGRTMRLRAGGVVLFLITIGASIAAVADEPVDLKTVHRIKDEAFRDSKVMDHLF